MNGAFSWALEHIKKAKRFDKLKIRFSSKNYFNILIGLLSSNLTKEIVSKLLDKIAESIKNKASASDVNKLKEVLWLVN